MGSDGKGFCTAGCGGVTNILRNVSGGRDGKCISEGMPALTGDAAICQSCGRGLGAHKNEPCAAGFTPFRQIAQKPTVNAQQALRATELELHQALRPAVVVPSLVLATPPPAAKQRNGAHKIVCCPSCNVERMRIGGRVGVCGVCQQRNGPLKRAIVEGRWKAGDPVPEALRWHGRGSGWSVTGQVTGPGALPEGEKVPLTLKVNDRLVVPGPPLPSPLRLAPPAPEVESVTSAPAPVGAILKALGARDIADVPPAERPPPPPDALAEANERCIQLGEELVEVINARDALKAELAEFKRAAQTRMQDKVPASYVTDVRLFGCAELDRSLVAVRAGLASGAARAQVDVVRVELFKLKLLLQEE